MPNSAVRSTSYEQQVTAATERMARILALTSSATIETVIKDAAILKSWQEITSAKRVSR